MTRNEELARTFHHENPWVLATLVRLARELKEKGHQKIGIGMLFEVVRWQHYRTTSGDDFKLNNSFRAWYARHIMDVCPDLADIFETRVLRSS